MNDRKYWFDIERRYPCLRWSVQVLGLLALICTAFSQGYIDSEGKPVLGDFVVFWAASHLALSGHAADAYDMHRLLAAEQLVQPSVGYGFAWYYLPTFHLLILPLACLSFSQAYFAFSTVSLAAYLGTMRQIARYLPAGALMTLFPGLWLNFLVGQNGFVTASLAGASLLLLKTRPTLSGICIGLLAIKPQLAVLFPVALLAARAWRTLGAATLTVVVFVSLSTVVLGVDSLGAALASLTEAQHNIEIGKMPLAKMPTVFAAMRLLGAPIGIAYLAHALVAMMAAGLVWRVWRHVDDIRLRGASLMSASFLVSPYLLYYDLTWLLFPIAWMVGFALQTGWRKGDAWLLAAAWLLPAIMMPMAMVWSLPIAPVVLVALLLAVAGRATAPNVTGAVAGRD
ncbi:glycosyltransferase family 87 protein [Methyloparacoccus murrellii]